MKSINFNSFKLFLKEPAKNILFTSLFYSLWFIVDKASSAKYDLHSFSQRPIGIATLEDFDVGARVQLFYLCVVIFFFSFFSFQLLAYFIYKWNQTIIKSAETKLLNYTSIAGLVLLAFKMFEIEVYETQEIIYFLHKLFLVGVILRCSYFKTNILKIGDYLILITISFSGYFLIADINNLLAYTTNPDFYIVAFIIAMVLLITLNVVLRPLSLVKQRKRIDDLSYVLLPIIALPLVSILKDEIYLVLKRNNFGFNNQFLIYATLCVIVSSAMVFRYQKNKQIKVIRKNFLSENYFPLLVFTLTAYTAYNHFAEYYDEIFESSNVYLPIMEYQLFGVLSPLEKLNTHLFSDYFFGMIYTIFNGLKISEVDLYDFLLTPISYTLYYYLLYYLTRSGLLSFFCVFLFPFAEAMMPGGYCLGILAIFVLQKVILTQQNLKSYIFYFLVMLALALWRIDLGYVCVLAMPITIIYFSTIEKTFTINWKALTKAFLLVFISTFVLLALLSIYRNVNFFEKGAYFINYCRSAQSYGYNIIGWSNLPAYKMHYFIFPAIIGLAIIALIINHNQLNKTFSQRRALIGFLFICLFYFLNFNRGLIRHSLIEWTDTFTSSFAFIILATLPYIFFKKQPHSAKAITFCAISFFAISNYRLPDTKGLKSLFETFIIKLKTTNNINLSKIESRVKNKPAKASLKYEPFVKFIKENTQANETFIDFSNKGMLYFYTQKETPSWFYQNPLCLQNDFLQKNFLKDLSNYKTPYLLFNELSELGYEQVDQVPNTLRHYRMAEYFYKNYEPHVILGNYCVWKHNGVKGRNKIDTILKLKTSPDSTITNLNYSFKANSNKKYLAKVVYKKAFENVNPEINFVSSDTGFAGTLKYYRVSENIVYSMFDFNKINYRLNFKNPNHALDSVIILECDYLPDITMQKFLNYNFRKLPYVWAQYDEFVKNEKILFRTNFDSQSNKLIYKANLPVNLDKNSGNTVLISVMNTSQNLQKLTLAFGRIGDNNLTKINIEILPSKKEELYAIRISSIYKWHDDVNQISIEPENHAKVRIKSMAITKGL